MWGNPQLHLSRCWVCLSLTKTRYRLLLLPGPKLPSFLSP